MNTLLEQLKTYFESNPREVIEKEWSKYSMYDDIGPTVEDFMSFTNERLFNWEKDILEDIAIIQETSNFYSEFFYLYMRKINS